MTFGDLEKHLSKYSTAHMFDLEIRLGRCDKHESVFKRTWYSRTHVVFQVTVPSPSTGDLQRLGLWREIPARIGDIEGLERWIQAQIRDLLQRAATDQLLFDGAPVWRATP